MNGDFPVPLYSSQHEGFDIGDDGGEVVVLREYFFELNKLQSVSVLYVGVVGGSVGDFVDEEGVG